MQHPNGAPCPDNRATGDLDRVVTALRDNTTFDRAQLAWLMAEAYRWGYEARVDEENGAWPPPKVFNLGKWFDQATERQRADNAARLPRPSDHRGGTVAWDEPDALRAVA